MRAMTCTGAYRGAATSDQFDAHVIAGGRGEFGVARDKWRGESFREG